MDRNKLLSLIESWREGDCPGEILLDAMMDYGIDVDVPAMNCDMTIKSHMERCNGSFRERSECWSAKSIERQLKAGTL